MLRYKTEIAWFSRLVQHPARKWSGSILITPEPAWGSVKYKFIQHLVFIITQIWTAVMVRFIAPRFSHMV